MRRARLRAALLLALLAAAACGTKGPPRAPGAKAPPAMFAEPEEAPFVTEPQPGLEGEGYDDEVEPEAVPDADALPHGDEAAATPRQVGGGAGGVDASDAVAADAGEPARGEADGGAADAGDADRGAADRGEADAGEAGAVHSGSGG